MINKEMKIQIIKHFFENDKEYSGDYLYVEVIINGKKVRHYGDDYHDKGCVQADAFVDGILFALNIKPKITKIQKADGKTS